MQSKVITYEGCINQIYFLLLFAGLDDFLLTVMAYDRYVAICYPLRYTLLMNLKACILLATVAWITSFFYALMHSVMTARLNFCHSLKLNYFFCDVKPLLELACGDIRLNQWLIFIVTGSLAMVPCFFTFFSYLYIISFLLFKNHTCRVLHKALWSPPTSPWTSVLQPPSLLNAPSSFPNQGLWTCCSG